MENKPIQMEKISPRLAQLMDPLADPLAEAPPPGPAARALEAARQTEKSPDPVSEIPDLPTISELRAKGASWGGLSGVALARISVLSDATETALAPVLGFANRTSVWRLKDGQSKEGLTVPQIKALRAWLKARLEKISEALDTLDDLDA